MHHAIVRIVNTAGGEAPGDDGEELDRAWKQPARPAGEGTGRRTDFVQSLDRGLAVIR